MYVFNIFIAEFSGRGSGEVGREVDNLFPETTSQNKWNLHLLLYFLAKASKINLEEMEEKTTMPYDQRMGQLCKYQDVDRNFGKQKQTTSNQEQR